MTTPRIRPDEGDLYRVLPHKDLVLLASGDYQHLQCGKLLQREDVISTNWCGKCEMVLNKAAARRGAKPIEMRVPGGTRAAVATTKGKGRPAEARGHAPFEDKTCPRCLKPLVRREGEQPSNYRQRVFCSRECYDAVRATRALSHKGAGR